MKNKKSYRNPSLQARLSFNDGYAEEPIYSIKAATSEKNKGFNMIDLIMDNFNIVDREIKLHRESAKAQLLEEMNHLSRKIAPPPVKLSRDEKGNLISPFASKRKLI